MERHLGPLVAAGERVTYGRKEGRKARKYIMMIAPNFRPIQSGMSKRGDGGSIATVTRGLCDAYYSKMMEGFKTNKLEVKANKLDKRLQSYGHLKFCMIFHRFYLSLTAADA